jgi:ABC-type multidrug transport system ATPase subunit
VGINYNYQFDNRFDNNHFMNNLLHVDSVTKSYGVKQVLSDIYISCNKGEIVGLLGRNGVGKSTLLKIIFGSVKADTKFIKIGDKRIHGLFDNKNLINYLPQKSFLPNHIKVSRIIPLFCGKTNADLVLSNEYIISLVNKQVSHLSGGEKRLLEVVLVIYSDAKYILIDEPFNGIAPIYKDEIKSLIKGQSKDKGFIITDHDYRDIMDVATKIILLRDGGTKVINDREELKYWGYIPESQ